MIIKKHIRKSDWGRPGKKNDVILGIVIHWTENPMQSAYGVWKYFDEKIGKYGSAHYIIGLNGDIIEAVPPDEITYHCGSSKIDPISGKIYTDLARKNFGIYCTKDNLSPNYVTLGIECCHIDYSGKMTQETMGSLEWLMRDLARKYKCNDFYLHKEIVGYKDCHKFFVDNPLEWSNLKSRSVLK